MMYRYVAVCVLLLLLLSPMAMAFEFWGNIYNQEDVPQNEVDVWLWQDRSVQKTTTNEKGDFFFRDVAKGQMHIVAYKEGHALVGYGAYIIDDSACSLFLLPPAKASLRVVTPEYVPIPNARVRSMEIEGAFHVPVEDLTTLGFPALRSNEIGELTIPFLPVNSYARITMTHYEYADTLLPFVPVRERKHHLVMQRGKSIMGQVRYNDQNIAKARVTVFQQNSTGGKKITERQADSEGLFRFRLPEGEYSIVARHADYASASPQVFTIEEEQEEFALTVALNAAHIVRGKIVDKKERPISGVRVSFRLEGIVYDQTFSQAGGAFQMQVAAEKGFVTVLPPPGFMTEGWFEVGVEFGESELRDLSPIVLLPLPVIRGKLELPDGSPAANTFMITTNLPAPFWLITGEEGQFELPLPYMPETKTVDFHAEHDLRFMKSDFQVAWKKDKPVAETLKPYSPGEAPGDPPIGRNSHLTSLIGEPAKPIEVKDWFNSEPVSMEDLKGKVVVLTLWGCFDTSTYGISVLEEIRALHQLYKEVDDVAFITIHDATTELHEVQVFVEDNGITFPVGFDADPFTFDHYGAAFIPQTILIGKHGIVRYINTEGRLLELIKTLRRRE